MTQPAPANFACDVVLADGGTAHVRQARADDVEAIEAFHARLSRQSIQFRFFSSMPRLRPSLLHRFTHGGESSFVLLALLGTRVIAMAMYHRKEPQDKAEVAFAVQDDQHGRGLGTLLLEHLAAVARAHGIHRLEAETLANNRKMLAVFRDAGFDAGRARERGIVHVEFPIDPTPRLRAAVERREHASEARSIGRLLAPGAIAVVGAHDRADSDASRLLRSLREGAFSGPLFAVGSGLDVPPSLRALAKPVGLAIVCAEPDEVPGHLEDCAEVGAAGAVITSGLSGEDGEARERELGAYARANGLRVIGPRSLGLLNRAPEVNLSATLLPAGKGPSPAIGLASQSRESGRLLLESARELALPIRSFVSLGHRADVSANDLLQYWEDDEATRVIGLHLESLGNPRKFARIARRVARHKPIVAVADSPPAPEDEPSLAWLLDQTGVVRVASADLLLAAVARLARQTLPAEPPPALAEPPALAGFDLGPVHAVVDASLAATPEGSWLREEAVRHVLEAVGLRLAPGPASDGDVYLAGACCDSRLGLLVYGETGGRRHWRIPPLGEAEAEALAVTCRAGAFVAPLRDVFLRVSRLAECVPEISELELCCNGAPSGLWLRSARMHIGSAQPLPDGTWRRLS